MPIRYFTYTSNLSEKNDREIFDTLMSFLNQKLSDLGVQSVAIHHEDVTHVDMGALDEILAGLVKLRNRISTDEQNELNKLIECLNKWILEAKNNFDNRDWK
jgi:hypothetical protein